MYCCVFYQWLSIYVHISMYLYCLCMHFGNLFDVYLGSWGRELY